VVGLLAGATPARADVEHVVVQGEYLGAIAARYGTTVRELLAANDVRDPDLVVPGQRLVVRGVAPADPAPLTSVTPAAAVDGDTGRSTGSRGGSGPVTTAARVAHTVAPGEHLSGIAQQYGTTVRAIVAANRIRNPNLVRDGVVLEIPVSVPSRLPERLLASPDRLALRPAFVRWAAEYRVPADLLQSLCWIESGWQSRVVSEDQAVGVCQLLPSTARFMSELIGTSLDPAVPEEGVRLGARYLRWLLDRTGDDEEAALAGYIQGLRSVAERGRFAETEAYIGAVMAMRDRFAV